MIKKMGVPEVGNGNNDEREMTDQRSYSKPRMHKTTL